MTTVSELAASDPAFVERTWQNVIEQMQSRGRASSRARYANAFAASDFDGLRHQRLLALARGAEWKLYLELLWETGAAQTDAALLQAGNVDWPTRTLTYFRKKTGTRAQLSISQKLATVLRHLPTTGPLFPKLSLSLPNSRSNWFRKIAPQAGLSGLSLHCYRYAWAERAHSAGMPERFFNVPSACNTSPLLSARPSGRAIARVEHLPSNRTSRRKKLFTTDLP